MKVGAALITQVIASLASAQYVPEECFGYSGPKGNEQKGKSINNESQVISKEFRYDMRLKKIVTCTGFSDELLGVTFILSTTTLRPPIELELESLGYRYGNSCSTTELEGDQYVKYLEISYGKDRVNSFFAKLGGDTNILVGVKQPLDEKKGWSFNEENQLTGLIGTESSDGINSLGVLIYQPECANDALGFNIDPTTGSKNFSAGLMQKNEQGPDGIYRFADTPMRFENKDLKPVVPLDNSIWKLNNPNLASDMKDWASEKPNIYYVSSALLILAVSLFSCICCCCQACYDPAPKIVDQPIDDDPVEIQLAKKKIKVNDVLNEQATCEEIAESQPTARRLVSQQDTESNEHIPVAVYTNEKDAKRQLEDDKRKSLAEQIMYGSAMTRHDSMHNSVRMSDHQTLDEMHGKLSTRTLEDRQRLFSDMTPPDTRDSGRRPNHYGSQVSTQGNQAMHLLKRHQSNTVLPQYSQQVEAYGPTEGIHDHRNILLQNPNQQIREQPYQVNSMQSHQSHIQTPQPANGRLTERIHINDRRPQATYSSQSVITYQNGQPMQSIDPFLQDQQYVPQQQDRMMPKQEVNQYSFNQGISQQSFAGQQHPQRQFAQPDANLHMSGKAMHDSMPPRRDSQRRESLQYRFDSQQHQNQQEIQSVPPTTPPQFPQVRTNQFQQHQLQSQQIQNSGHQQAADPYYAQPLLKLEQRQAQQQPAQNQQHAQSHVVQPQQPPLNQEYFPQSQTGDRVQPPNMIQTQQRPAQLSQPQPYQHQDNMSSIGQSQHQMASINESSIGRASYPETPNDNAMLTQTQAAAPSSSNVNNLTSQVQELENKLKDMQRQQTLRELTAEAAKQEAELKYQQQLQQSNESQQIQSLQMTNQQISQENETNQSMQQRQSIQQPAMQVAPPQPQIENKQNPIIVNINPQVTQDREGVTNFQLPLDNPTFGRNIASSNLNPNPSTQAVAAQGKTTADIDEQYRDIPELGGSTGKSIQQVDDMFNKAKMTSSVASNMPMLNTAANTINSQQLYKASNLGSQQNISAIVNNVEYPERTSATTSVIEQMNQIVENPASKPQRATPSPTYFTK